MKQRDHARNPYAQATSNARMVSKVNADPHIKMKFSPYMESHRSPYMESPGPFSKKSGKPKGQPWTSPGSQPFDGDRGSISPLNLPLPRVESSSNDVEGLPRLDSPGVAERQAQKFAAAMGTSSIRQSGDLMRQMQRHSLTDDGNPRQSKAQLVKKLRAENQSLRRRSVDLTQEVLIVQEQLAEATTKLYQFREKMERECETPLEMLLKLASTVSDVYVRSQMMQIIQSFASSEAYKPAFVKMLDENLGKRGGGVRNCNGLSGVTAASSDAKLDSALRSFLVSEFTTEDLQRMGGQQKYMRRNSINSLLMKATSVDLSRRSGTAMPEIQNDNVGQDVSAWDFDPDLCDEKQLNYICCDIFQQLGIMEQFDIPYGVLATFFIRVSSMYRQNPFHNFRHGFEVMRVSYIFLTKTQVTCLLDDHTILGFLIAAVCHDVDHPGHTNRYEINAQTETSRIYNDKSVLENHHAATAFRILCHEDSNVLKSMSREEFRDVRAVIVSAILSTDMEKHFKMLTKFRALISPGTCSEGNNDSLVVVADRSTTESDGDPTGILRVLTPDNITLKPGKEKEGRQLIVDILLHTADISFPVRPIKLSWKWASRLAEEFANQVKNEKSQGLPVLPFMEPGDEKVLAKGEMGFIDYIVQPLFTSICSFLPDMAVCLDRIKANRERYEKVHETGDLSFITLPTKGQ